MAEARDRKGNRDFWEMEFTVVEFLDGWYWSEWRVRAAKLLGLGGGLLP